MSSSLHWYKPFPNREGGAMCLDYANNIVDAENLLPFWSFGTCLAEGAYVTRPSEKVWC